MIFALIFSRVVIYTTEDESKKECRGEYKDINLNNPQ